MTGEHWIAHPTARTIKGERVLWDAEKIEQYKAAGWKITGPYTLSTEKDTP